VGSGRTRDRSVRLCAVGRLRTPRALVDAAAEDDRHGRARRRWLAALPDVVETLTTEWDLELGEPYEPGGQCGWIAPVIRPEGLVLKVGWRHREAEHEADALRLWDGDGAVRCVAERVLEDTSALLLERCEPGRRLKDALAEPDQDVVIARLMRRLWNHEPSPGHPFESLQAMCDDWADTFELDCSAESHSLDPGLAQAASALLRELPDTADRAVLLATDLHAENVLSAGREPWLVIDPKPFIGDPAYDPVQHMLNCDQRLAEDPVALSQRMASLLDLEPQRVRLWLFARCTQESLCDLTMREPARRLRP
jgi:streptomycin 6-kinase